MEYVARLLEDAEYIALLNEIENIETERIYCRHGFGHLMDVARLGWIRALEERKNVEKEQVYLAALLHDIGRVEEYKCGISHAEAGKRLAGEILLRIGCRKDWIEEIVQAIEEHQDGETGTVLGELLQKTDKEVRPCFRCDVSAGCKWSMEKRNTVQNWQ